MNTRKFSVLLAGAMIVAAGCSNGSSGDGGGSGKGDDVTIGFSAPDLSASFWVSMTYGVTDEAKKLGVHVVSVNAGGDANANQQISQLQDLLQRNVDAMIVGATDGDAVKPVVEQALSRKIPVVGLSSLPNTDKLTSAVGTDNAAMGKIQADCLGDALGGKGQVIMFAGPVGQSWAEDRASGFKKTVAAEYPGMEIVTTSNTADNRNSALTTMQDLTQRYPDVNGVYTVTDDIGAGVVDALRESKATDKIKVASANFSPTAEELVSSGAFVCVAAQEIVEQGRQAVRQAVAAARGEDVEKHVVTSVVRVDSGNIATVDLSAVRAPEGYTP
jgi:ABC-type sugar transport system substrate-binding protein